MTQTIKNEKEDIGNRAILTIRAFLRGEIESEIHDNWILEIESWLNEPCENTEQKLNQACMVLSAYKHHLEERAQDIENLDELEWEGFDEDIISALKQRRLEDKQSREKMHEERGEKQNVLGN